MKALRFSKYGPPSVLAVEERETPQPGPDQVLVQILAAAINPSDVKNVAGAFKASLPRTPGRDYAGIVAAGEGKGREVWGSGPAFGVACDGSHAEFVAIPTAWLSDKPEGMSMEEAGSIGVPFLVAWNGLIEVAQLEKGETVLVTGASGAVGRAVTQIAHWKGARVIGADRTDRSSLADVFINTESQELARECKTATGGKGADLVFDTVGGPLFESCLRSLAVNGRQVAISSVGDRRVSFDLIDFYHDELRLIGVDSMKFTGVKIAQMLDALKPGFESGALKPYDVQTWPLERAVEAYEAAAKGGAIKQVLLPSQTTMR
ncbi:MAG TPA: zinc-binding alcohol dehydrogenase family protein [Rhizomicrobium sp.]|jgi:NADPH:quinone reductase-like Zn-dependent oxidoreductase|nr:zinc-binding alcohol dehydrogenase family protein [Rhizomicrobium sp.]